eukprot:SAG25_NODE_63_length_17756_cov_10.156765_3_plen_237_part_00
MEQCCKCEFRSKRHVLRRQSGDLHRSASEISSFSLPAAVSRGEIDFRLRAGGISPRTSLSFRIRPSLVAQLSPTARLYSCTVLVAEYESQPSSYMYVDLPSWRRPATHHQHLRTRLRRPRPRPAPSVDTGRTRCAWLVQQLFRLCCDWLKPIKMFGSSASWVSCLTGTRSSTLARTGNTGDVRCATTGTSPFHTNLNSPGDTGSMRVATRSGVATTAGAGQYVYCLLRGGGDTRTA